MFLFIFDFFQHPQCFIASLTSFSNENELNRAYLLMHENHKMNQLFPSNQTVCRELKPAIQPFK